MELSGEAGLGTAARIFDFIKIGSPFLLSALAAFLCLEACEALGPLSVKVNGLIIKGDTYSVSKKWPRSADCMAGNCVLDLRLPKIYFVCD